MKKSSLTNFNNPSLHPIQIRFAYAWNGENGEMLKEKKLLWALLKKILKQCCDTINSAQIRKKLPLIPFRVSRMRAIHGDIILNNLLKRCDETNILIFDITERNPNVMLELGIALGIRNGVTGNIFILTEVDKDEKPLQKIPSDLQGYLLTYYQTLKHTPSFVDLIGFKSALLARIKDQVRVSGFIIEEAQFQTDDDEENKSPK